MERKICLNTYFRGISFQGRAEHDINNRIKVENPLGEGRKISWHYPYNGVWIIDQK
jgi:hypothetical protein